MLRFLRLFLSGWTAILVFALAASLFAAPASSVHGTVFDPDGLALPNATVELLDHGVPVATVSTNAKGQYEIARQPLPGERLRVSGTGFRTLEKTLEDANGAAMASVDCVLQIAPLSEAVTVISTGSPTPQAQLGASVTLLSATEFQGTRDLQEALRMAPGVQAIQVGQAGGSTSLFIRGGGSDANKVLIDGIPMNDIGGSMEFANLASAGIEHVEILRGPNSVLYGSDALAAVVSLTTARGTTPLPLLTYTSEGGNFGSYLQEGALSGRFDRFDYFTSYTRSATNNSVADDKYHNGTLTGNYGWKLTPASSLRATVHHDQLASGAPNAIELYGLPMQARQGNEDAYFGATWEAQNTANWSNLVRYGGLRLRSQYTQFAAAGTPQSGYTLGAPVTLTGANGYTVSGQALEFNSGPPYPYTYPGSTDKDFVHAQSGYRFNPHLQGLAAFRYEDERGYSGAPSSSVERGNYSYTFQVQGDLLNRVFYTVGGGVEDNGLFGLAFTPRVSVAWQAAGGTKLRASFGKGIKEPALFDQLDSLYTLLENNTYSKLAAQYHIAPIGPENSRSYDGGIDQYLFAGRTRLSLSLFHNEFTNGIEYIPPQGLTDLGLPSSIVTIASNANFGATVNSKAYRAQGVEAEIESQLTKSIFVRAGYAYTDARIQRSFTGDAIGPSQNPAFPTVAIGAYSPLIGARPFRVAPHTGNFQAGYRRGRVYTALTGTLVSRRDDSDFLAYDANYGSTLLLPNRNLDAAFQRIDWTASYRATRALSLQASARNLLCQHYSEAFGYPSQPFGFLAGVKLTLGAESWRWK